MKKHWNTLSRRSTRLLKANYKPQRLYPHRKPVSITPWILVTCQPSSRQKPLLWWNREQTWLSLKPAAKEASPSSMSMTRSWSFNSKKQTASLTRMRSSRTKRTCSTCKCRTSNSQWIWTQWPMTQSISLCSSLSTPTDPTDKLSRLHLTTSSSRPRAWRERRDC